MSLTFRLIWMCALLISFSSARADETWTDRLDPALSVRLRGRAVTLTMKPSTEPVPPSVGITFFDQNGGRRTVELKALSPDRKTSGGSDLLRFEGPWYPVTQSYIGFEIRIPLGTDTGKVIHSSDWIHSQ